MGAMAWSSWRGMTPMKNSKILKTVICPNLNDFLTLKIAFLH
jgi:hypothetical protein